MMLNEPCIFAEEMSTAVVVLVCGSHQELTVLDALSCCAGIHVVPACSLSHVLEVLETDSVALGIMVSRGSSRGDPSLVKRLRATDAGRHLPLIVLDPDPSGAVAALEGCMGAPIEVSRDDVEPSVLRGKVNLFVDIHRQRKALEIGSVALERAREFLVAELTHDLRSPLAAIVMCVEKLTFDLRLNNRMYRTLGQLNLSVRRLTGVIDRLPAFGESTADDVLGMDVRDAAERCARAEPHVYAAPCQPGDGAVDLKLLVRDAAQQGAQ